jgi:hypothetical protein
MVAGEKIFQEAFMIVALKFIPQTGRSLYGVLS